MRIAIFGTGGVGGYFGGKLAQYGHDVTFIAHGEHLQALQANGLQVESDSGNFTIYPIKATDNPAEVGEVDYVIDCVKAWQNRPAAKQMPPLVGKNTTVVPLLNGVDAPEELAEWMDKEQVLGGYCRVLSRIVAPGKIRQAGILPFVAFGELDGRQSQRVAKLKEIFEVAEVTAQTPDDILVAMWRKLTFISSLGGVGTLSQVSAGIVRTQPETRSLLQKAMQEVVAVAQGNQVNLPDDTVEYSMGLVDNFPEDGTASMQRDILSGQPSELDAQNGAIVRYGIRANIPTPTHTYIYETLLPLEQAARKEMVHAI